MPKVNNNDESKGSAKVDRRAMLRGALAVGGATMLAGTTSANAQTAVVAEREWARTLARHIANQLPEAARALPNLQLNRDQVEELRRAFENTLVINMGCEEPRG